MSDARVFEALRRHGLDAIESHSRMLWSDYNVHDPGVAILEQFCFALTELGHRAGFAVTDLLADPDGAVALTALGLHPPAVALPMRPVTAADLGAALTQACPLARRVFVAPSQEGDAIGRGFWDLFVAPARHDARGAALMQAWRAFHARRGLCEDIGAIALAEAERLRLEALVEVDRREPPERLAAAIYAVCERLMLDARAPTRAVEITPQDAFDAPELLFGDTAGPAEPAGALNDFFRAIGQIDGVERVIDLAFVAEGAGAAEGTDPFARPLARGRYRELATPRSVAGAANLRLTSRGLDVPYDFTAMTRQLTRLRMRQSLAQRRELVGAAWRPRPFGRRRDFSHVRLGAGLPRAFHAGDAALSPKLDPEARAAALQLRGYLAFGDAPLANAAADLAALPQLFRASDDDGASYAAAPLDFGGAVDLARGDGDSVRAAVAPSDPWRDRKGRALNLLLALHGEAFKQSSLRRLDAYRVGEAREQRVLANRVRLLRDLATLNANRGGAADHTVSQRSHFVGLGRKLCILLDFPDRGWWGPTARLRRLGLRLVNGTGPDGAWRIDRATLRAPDNPFDTTPRLQEGGAQLDAQPDAQTLLRETAFAGPGLLGVAAFHAAVSLDNFAITPTDGGWALDLDAGDKRWALRCATFASPDVAEARANALASLFAALNAGTECVTVVEDILLRGPGRDFAPLTAHLVFAGFSVRTATPAFRQLAEETARLLAPAHLALRFLWIAFDRAEAMHRLHLRWRRCYAALAVGREGAAEACEAAAAALHAALWDERPA